MSVYAYNKQIANETTIAIETNDRELFFGIEKTINEFLNNFTNENETDICNGIELTDSIGIENWNYFRNENEEQTGIETTKNNGNELQSQIQNSSKNIRGNELQREPIVITTKFGTARLGKSDQYFRITSNKEGNLNKLLHRLIYEDYHKVTLLDEAVIHHIDENKLNNHIDNLVAVSKADHNLLHTRNSLPVDKDNANIRIQRNTTGYYGVYKQVCPRCSQGFTWKYTYKHQGVLKTLESVDLRKLEAKVKSKGLTWRKL